VDTDLALFVVDIDVSVKTRSCSDSHFKWDAELLRLAFEVRREVAQTRMRREVTQTHILSKMRGCSDPRQTRSYSDPHLKSMFPFGREVRILVEMRPSR